MVRQIRGLTVLSLLLISVMLAPAGWAGAAKSKLEIFSWWTTGGEAAGLAGATGRDGSSGVRPSGILPGGGK